MICWGGCGPIFFSFCPRAVEGVRGGVLWVAGGCGRGGFSRMSRFGARRPLFFAFIYFFAVKGGGDSSWERGGGAFRGCGCRVFPRGGDGGRSEGRRGRSGDVSWLASPGSARVLRHPPPFVPAADTCARMTVEWDLCTGWVRLLVGGGGWGDVLRGPVAVVGARGVPIAFAGGVAGGRVRARYFCGGGFCEGVGDFAGVPPLVPTPREGGM